MLPNDAALGVAVFFGGNMAQYDTIRTAGGVRTAAIDEGLRAHMSKVYGTMSVGMLITFAVAWAVGTAPAPAGCVP